MQLSKTRGNVRREVSKSVGRERTGLVRSSKPWESVTYQVGKPARPVYIAKHIIVLARRVRTIRTCEKKNKVQSDTKLRAQGLGSEVSGLDFLRQPEEKVPRVQSSENALFHRSPTDKARHPVVMRSSLGFGGEFSCCTNELKRKNGGRKMAWEGACLLSKVWVWLLGGVPCKQSRQADSPSAPGHSGSRTLLGQAVMA